MTTIPKYKYLDKEFLRQEALRHFKTQFPNLSENSVEFGAYRHAYGSAILAREFGPDLARIIGAGNELSNENWNEHLKDFHNNKIGREILGDFGSYFDDESIASAVRNAVINGDLVFGQNDSRLNNFDGVVEYGMLLNPGLWYASAAQALSLSIGLVDKFSGLIAGMLQNLSAAESQVLIRRSDPLVLDLNGNGEIDLISISESKTFFDLDNDGFREQVGWVSGVDGILALDANENGKVDKIEKKIFFLN